MSAREVRLCNWCCKPLTARTSPGANFHKVCRERAERAKHAKNRKAQKARVYAQRFVGVVGTPIADDHLALRAEFADRNAPPAETVEARAEVIHAMLCGPALSRPDAFQRGPRKNAWGR